MLIQRATPDDIEDLFSRLNNGEPLNAAEKRNAMGGDLVRLIRTVATRPFFAERLHFTNARHHHYELAARLVAAADRPSGAPLDLRSAALDTLVRERRRLTERERGASTERIDRGLDRMARVFGSADPLLSSPSWATLFFVFLESVPAPEAPDQEVRAFLTAFQRNRLAALDMPEHERDEALVEFSGLMQHGAQDPRSIARRLEILRSAWLRYRAAAGASTSPAASTS